MDESADEEQGVPARQVGVCLIDLAVAASFNSQSLTPASVLSAASVPACFEDLPQEAKQK